MDKFKNFLTENSSENIGIQQCIALFNAKAKFGLIMNEYYK